MKNFAFGHFVLKIDIHFNPIQSNRIKWNQITSKRNKSGSTIGHIPFTWFFFFSLLLFFSISFIAIASRHIRLLTISFLNRKIQLCEFHHYNFTIETAQFWIFLFLRSTDCFIVFDVKHCIIFFYSSFSSSSCGKFSGRAIRSILTWQASEKNWTKKKIKRVITWFPGTCAEYPNDHIMVSRQCRVCHTLFFLRCKSKIWNRTKSTKNKKTRTEKPFT